MFQPKIISQISSTISSGRVVVYKQFELKISFLINYAFDTLSYIFFVIITERQNRNDDFVIVVFGYSRLNVSLHYR